MRMFQSLIGRLQTAAPTPDGDGGVVFQSLIGRLQTAVRKPTACAVGQFQSLIGRLQTFPHVRCVSLQILVSIPHR